MGFFSKNKPQLPQYHKNDTSVSALGFYKPHKSTPSHIDNSIHYLSTSSQTAIAYGSHDYGTKGEIVRGSACAASIKHNVDNDGVIIGYVVATSENSTDDVDCFNKASFSLHQMPNKNRTEKIIKDLYDKNNLLSLTTTEIAYDTDGALHCVMSNVIANNSFVGKIDPAHYCQITKVNNKKASAAFHVSEIKLDTDQQYLIQVTNEVIRNLPPFAIKTQKDILLLSPEYLKINEPLQLAKEIITSTGIIVRNDLVTPPETSVLATVIKVPDFKVELVRGLIVADNDQKKINILKRIIALKKQSPHFSIGSTFEILKTEFSLVNQHCKQSEFESQPVYTEDQLNSDYLLTCRALKIENMLASNIPNQHTAFRNVLITNDYNAEGAILKLKDINTLYNMFKEHPYLTAKSSSNRLSQFFNTYNKHTKPWKMMLGELRRQALEMLAHQINNCVSQDMHQTKLKMLTDAREMAIFKEHKNNHWYEGAFGRTRTVEKIDLWIEQLKKDPYQLLFAYSDMSTGKEIKSGLSKGRLSRNHS